MDKLISVIIPVYNAAGTIERCIRSILNQSFTGLEVIVVDDGSTDHSLEICERLQNEDTRVKIIRQENSGVGSARNTGLAHAVGRYISFVDSDDWLDPEFYGKAVEAGLFLNNPDVVWYGHIDEIEEDLFKVFRVPSSGYFNLSEKNITFIDTFVRYLWNKLYRRDIITDRSISFTSAYSYGEDSVFSLEYLLHCTKLLTVSDVYYHYSFSKITDSTGSLSKQVYKKDYNAFAEDLMSILHRQNTEAYIRQIYVDTWFIHWVFFEAVENLNKCIEFQKNRKKRIIQYKKIYDIFNNHWEEIRADRTKKKIVVKLLNKKLFNLLDCYYRYEKKSTERHKKHLF